MKYKESVYNNYFVDSQIEVYNSFSKARVKLMDANFIKELLGKKECDMNSDDLVKFNILKKNGFIVKEEIDEFSIVNYMFKKYYFTSHIKNIVLMPTLNCNFGCSYCFEKSMCNKFTEEKNYFNSIKAYFDKEKKYLSNIHLSMFGGEPLLKKKEMFDLADYILTSSNGKVNLECSVTTNGSLIEEKDIELLKVYNCKYLQITLDGSREQHNKSRTFKNGKPSFDLLMDKLKMASRLTKDNKDFKIILRFNLLNNTIDEVKSILETIEEDLRENIYILFRSVFNTDCFSEVNSNDNSNLGKFYEMAVGLKFLILQNKRFFSYCEACGDLHTFHILPDLTIWKCISDLSFTKACIGKMDLNGDIKWNVENIINWFNLSDFSYDEECRNCSILPDCMGGCIMYKAKFGQKRCDEIHSLSDSYKYGK